MKGTMILLAILLAGCAGTAPQTAEPSRMEAPKTIESLDIPLPGPSSEMDAAYLGLEESTDAFRMDQIKAGVLVVEVFDMYCRFCQGMAPKVDEIYELNLRSGFAGEVDGAATAGCTPGHAQQGTGDFPTDRLSVLSAATTGG